MQILSKSILCALVLSGNLLFCQPVDSAKIPANVRPSIIEAYGQLGAGVGMNMGLVQVGAFVILDNQWGVGVGYRLGAMGAINKPSDYYCDGCMGNPAQDVFYTLALRAVRYAEGAKARFGFELGPSLMQYHEAHFTRQDPVFPVLGRTNYALNHTKIFSPGIDLVGKIQWWTKGENGWELTAFTNINGQRSQMGVTINANIGWRKKG